MSEDRGPQHFDGHFGSVEPGSGDGGYPASKLGPKGGFREVLCAEGRLQRQQQDSGPIAPFGTEVVLRTSDDPDEDVRLESILRQHEGFYVKITIEKIDGIAFKHQNFTLRKLRDYRSGEPTP